MDRGKQPPKKPPIRRGLPLPDKIIPLGSKGRPDQDPKPTPSLYSDRKREASAPLPSHVIPPKTKLVGLTPLGRAAPEISRPSSSAVLHKPGIKTIEVPPIELVDRVLAADEAEDDESIDKILCGALKSLKTVRAKPSPALYLGLMYLAKVKPMFFESENVIETTCSLLKRDIGMSFKSKGNALVSVVACNLLMHAFVYEHNWPDIFVKVYLEDAHGERVWVDHPYCKEFVTNIQTAFGTKLASAHLQMATDPLRGSLSDVSGSGSPSREDAEGSQASSTPTLGSEEGDLGSESQETMPRYSLLRDEIEKDVVDFVKEQLVRRQGMDTPRNLLRLLTATCGFSEVRLITAQRLEMWLQNPKLTRPAQELLVSTCVNCCTHSQEDVEVIGHLIKIRLKTKPLINHYLISMKELLSQHKENLPTVVKHVIYNELSNARNPNNMALLGALFQHSPELAAKNLAAVFQDLLMNRDDYLRALRALFREIVKALRYDVDFVAFCRGLMTEKTDRQFTELEKAIKDRMFASLCDLICLASLLSVTPQIREIVAAYTRGERKASDMESLRAFQAQVSMTQRDCVWWIHTIAISMFTLTQGELNKVIQKLVFLDTHEGYCSKDNWPQETDRGLLLSLLSEVPVQEDTLMRLLIMGLERTIPLAAGEALDLVDKLVKRAAVLQSEDFQVLKIERTTLIDVVLNSCVYHHPENITLPQGYQVPSLAIANFYWKGWILLLIMAAFNPSNIGRAGWDNYPILRYFMEMVMTNNFKFPMATRAKDDKTIEDLKNQELQVAQLEKQAILEFENHLARVQIMEGNSLLLTQLMKLEPNGPVRRPPIQILDQLQHYNKVLHLGHMLCRSRNPDFLLDIIQSQGTSQSMPWLAELVNSAEGSLDVLPVQCLCEFLINQEADKDGGGGGSDGGESSSSSKQKVHKQEQLLARLQSLVFDPNTDPRNTSEVLGYFLTRLSSKQQSARTLASKGLAMVLSPRSGEDAMEVEEPSDSDSPLSSHKWLLQDVPAIPNFETVKSQATTALRSACQIDTDPRAVSAYIIFLSHHVLPADLNELAQDLAQLIVERPTMLTCILPHEGASPAGDETLAAMLRIFSNYVIKAIKSTDEEEGYRWSESQDQVFLRWHSGESATMHILVVHAMIILLTYGEPKVKSEFTYLLGTWCPGNAPPPSAYLVDTSEEALLLPDWLKLRMIRSSVDQLVIAALQDLEPAQLVLFIQSFGIPVQSMSKLLAHLDAAVVQMPQAMDAAVVDKSYMAQLVEVQQMRGAQGGYQFLGLLNHQPKEEEKEDEKAMEVSDSEQEKKPTLDQTMLKDIQDQDQLQVLVLKLVDLPQATTMSDKRDIWRNMQKAMLKERGVGNQDQTLCCRLIQALRSILTGDQKETFIEAIRDHPSYPCSLLKHMASVQERTTPKSSQSDFIALLEMLQNTLPSTGQLVSTIKACMRRVKAGTRSRPERVGEGDEAHSLEKEMLKPPSQRNHLEDLLEECLGRNANKQTLNAHDRASMLTRLMHQESDRKDSGFSSSKTQTSTCGLLMDWLTRIDPEVIRSCPDIQEEVMFRSRTLPGKVGDSSGGDGPGTGSGGSGYLLALLTHQTSWDTLHSCISFLLGREDAVERLDSTAVLDFLWACVHIPKIWQGRDTKAPKRYADENILMIDPLQLCTLADFIITECQTTSSTPTIPSSPTSSRAAAGDGASRSGCPTPSARLPLLLNCCRGSAELIGSLVEHLSRKAQEASTSGSLYQNLLMEVYIQMPKALEKFMEDISTAGYRPHGIGASSYIDALVHRLLTVLSDRKRDENNKQKVEDANVICRKLATMHPLVFFRQLSLLVVLMRGRTQLNWREFRGSGHLGFFHHVVGLLSLLQPGLFQEDGKAVNGIMEAFFTVLQRYGSSKKPIESLVTRFVTLLYQYSSSNPSQARSVLQQNSATLNAMAQNHPNNTQLKSILASTSLSSSSKDQSEGSVLMAGDDPAPTEQLPFIEGIPGVGNREETYSPTPGAKGEGGEESVWTPEFIRKMSAKMLTPNNMDDVIDALNEIEGASFRKHEMLHHFATEFASLMTSSNTECRAMAFCLTIRYLRYNPCCGEKCLPSYLDALASDDGCVVQTALKYLADFTALCQEQATTILQQAFLVGVHHKIDTVPPIAETLQLLSMDSTPTQSAS